MDLQYLALTDGSNMGVSPCQLQRILYGLGSNPRCFKSHPPKELLETPASTTLSPAIPQPPPVSWHSLLSDKSVSRLCGRCFTSSLVCPSSGAPRESGPRPRPRPRSISGSGFCQRAGVGVRAGEQLETKGSVWVECPWLQALVLGCGSQPLPRL